MASGLDGLKWGLDIHGKEELLSVAISHEGWWKLPCSEAVPLSTPIIARDNPMGKDHGSVIEHILGIQSPSISGQKVLGWKVL